MQEVRKTRAEASAREKVARQHFDEMVTRIINSPEYKNAVKQGASPSPLEKYRKAPFAVSTAGAQQGPATRKKVLRRG